MQFKIATIALMASLVAAESTLYITEEVTLTSCAPTVTNCPARSTVTSMTTYPAPTTTEGVSPISSEAPVNPETLTTWTTVVQTITSCHPTVTNCPVGQTTTTVIPVTTAPVETTPVQSSAPVETTPVQSIAPVTETVSQPPTTVTVTINSCPVESSTWTTLPAPITTAPVVPTTPAVPVVTEVDTATETTTECTTTAVPTISGAPVPISNGTTVVPPRVTSPPVPGSAAAMTGSFATLGFAALVAVFFA